MVPRITIKKYPNRRLYNTEQSDYITLEDVSDLIKRGFQIEVVDVATGDDVTALVLTQIVMNKAKQNHAILPVSLLHLVIQYGESHLDEFFKKYLEVAIQNYLGYRKQMEDQIHAYMGMGMNFSTLAENSLKNLDPTSFFSPPPKKEKKEE